ncbi:hypothetical protein PC116_g5299 [Phytophthora cactorum]|uniref:Uncharacterized protein n=1 Tax=Phytophthora cactorum TaxID=29920 RepID=A0A8T1LGL2_9STRA|nr:hypothetical protein PC111_g4213 [Phytophthora cactorum]KAG2990890.1 hypothetical protein PC118_g5392 [Phytophthora cactorum]KAG3033895.1 hypothetical protein PC119_g5094 [Phytophthora cactorum]KAG3097141.1 hypothetical protein PC122_g4681 [Phytophthora cactorum]KAG4246928.1 hypothetical protein PC116_g5299 [Phytophthora cactorum]
MKLLPNDFQRRTNATASIEGDSQDHELCYVRHRLEVLNNGKKWIAREMETFKDLSIDWSHVDTIKRQYIGSVSLKDHG